MVPIGNNLRSAAIVDTVRLSLLTLTPEYVMPYCGWFLLLPVDSMPAVYPVAITDTVLSTRSSSGAASTADDGLLRLVGADDLTDLFLL
ncbi:hypothetical protein D3C81_1393630 [compost metagenome]